MRAVLAAMLALALVTVPSALAATPKRGPELNSPENLLRWINGYRTHGNVEKVPSSCRR